MSSTTSRRGRLSRTGSSATEDQALNQIAHEAEARLSAKRAARAEARTIRMKELERQQKEAEAEMDKQFKLSTTGVVGRSASAGGISNLVKDETDAEMNGPLVPEKILKSVQDNLRDTEEKYRKAMVSIAQLDNEKQALLYQVDCLKDRLDEEEEVSSEVKNELTDLTKECNRHQRTIKERDDQIQRLKEAIAFRDNWLAERGLSLYDDIAKDDEEFSNALQAGQDSTDNMDLERSSVSDTDRSRSNSQSSTNKNSNPDEKEALVAEVRKLQEEILVLKQGEKTDTPKAITADLEELRREFTRQINDFRIKLQKAEQENARLEGVVMRLESQVKRYKTQAESAVTNEDELKSENRKLNRELRRTQDEVSELATANDHLQKRLEKMKSRRKEEL